MRGREGSLGVEPGSVYDHDTLRLAAAWSGQGFIDWNGINFNGRHQVHPRIVGKVHATNSDGPGWANPSNQSFADLRVRGRDGRFYGPLPRSWAHFKGLYRHGDRVILAYTVGTAEILETPGLETDPAHPDQAIFTRTLEIGPSPDDLTMRVADEGTAVSLTEDGQASLFRRDGFILLRVPRADSSRVLKVLISSGPSNDTAVVREGIAPRNSSDAPHARWPEAMAGGPQNAGYHWP